MVLRRAAQSTRRMISGQPVVLERTDEPLNAPLMLRHLRDNYPPRALQVPKGARDALTPLERRQGTAACSTTAAHRRFLMAPTISARVTAQSAHGAYARAESFLHRAMAGAECARWHIAKACMVETTTFLSGFARRGIALFCCSLQATDHQQRVIWHVRMVRP
jgi:hypothetical protein